MLREGRLPQEGSVAELPREPLQETLTTFVEGQWNTVDTPLQRPESERKSKQATTIPTPIPRPLTAEDLML